MQLRMVHDVNVVDVQKRRNPSKHYVSCVLLMCFCYRVIQKQASPRYFVGTIPHLGLFHFASLHWLSPCSDPYDLFILWIVPLVPPWGMSDTRFIYYYGDLFWCIWGRGSCMEKYQSAPVSQLEVCVCVWLSAAGRLSPKSKQTDPSKSVVVLSKVRATQFLYALQW